MWPYVIYIFMIYKFTSFHHAYNDEDSNYDEVDDDNYDGDDDNHNPPTWLPV